MWGIEIHLLRTRHFPLERRSDQGSNRRRDSAEPREGGQRSGFSQPLDQ